MGFKTTGNSVTIGAGVSASLNDLSDPTALNASLTFDIGDTARIRTKDADPDVDTQTVVIESGDTSGTGASGNVVVRIGDSDAARGKFQIRDGSEGSSGKVWTSIDNSGSGAWGAAGADVTLSNLSATAISQALTAAAGQTMQVKSADATGSDDSAAVVVASGSVDAGTRGLVQLSGNYVTLDALYLALPTGTSDPAGIPDGSIYYNTNTNKLRLRANSAWVSLN